MFSPILSGREGVHGIKLVLFHNWCWFLQWNHLDLEISFFSVFKHNFNFLNSYRAIKIIFSILGWVVVLCAFQRIGLFYLSCQILCSELITVFPFYPFDDCMVCTDSPCFIPDTSNMSLFFFFILLKFCQYYWFKKEKPSFLFHWDSLLPSCFQFYWFLLLHSCPSFLPSLISFLCLFS